jgi:hypothetical protein
MGYGDGCKFKMSISICKREIPISEARRLIATGSTEKLNRFISKKGKFFEARLVLKDGEVAFDFS